MLDEQKEANDFDSRADEFLNKEGTDNPTDSSTVNKPEDQEAKGDDPGAEPVKTEQVKAVEADKSLSVEEKLSKVKEILGDDEKAIEAYIKQKGYHNDPAWQKRQEQLDKLRKEAEGKSSLAKEDAEALAEFKKFRNSAEYIQTSMKTQGYTQDAIDRKLKESGFETKTRPEDDVSLVMSKLGINPDEIEPERLQSVKANIADIAKIADIIFEDRASKVLPKELGPLRDHLEGLTKEDHANKLVNSIKDTVKNEGILDYAKDVEPALNKFLDDNPDASQQDVLEHFRSVNHQLSIERLKAGKKKEERDDKRSNLRQNIPLSQGKPNVKKSGNFDKDADAFLESLNLQ